MPLPPNSPSLSEEDCGPGRLFAPTRSIRIRTDIPGPQSNAMGGMGKIVAATAHGARVIDVDGNIFIDFANHGTLGVGHTPDSVVKAIQDQAEKLIMVNPATAIPERQIALTALLNEITPIMGGEKQTLLFASELECLFYLQQLDPSLLVADERRNGFGRTGKMFVCEHENTPLDLMVIGGELGGGMNFTALTGRGDILLPYEVRTPLSAVTCSAVIAAIQFIRDQDLPRRAVQIGQIVIETAEKWVRDLRALDLIRGRGVDHALLFRTEKIAQQVAQTALQNGLLLSAEETVIPFNMALMIPEEQLSEGLDVLNFVLRSILD